jgi:hypothetical protein
MLYRQTCAAVAIGVAKENISTLLEKHHSSGGEALFSHVC